MLPLCLSWRQGGGYVFHHHGGGLGEWYETFVGQFLASNYTTICPYAGSQPPSLADMVFGRSVSIHAEEGVGTMVAVGAEV